ncbi:hypothetical protein Tco_0511523, partial [Tanacetum coccineum]
MTNEKENHHSQRPLCDVMPEDTLNHMETENAQSEERTRNIVDEDKEIDEVRLSTDKEGVSTDFEKVSTDRPIVSTDGSPKFSTGSNHEVLKSQMKKFKQLESDEELARKVQEEWEAEEERNRIAEENAANEELIKDFDDIKARIEADRLLAEKLQEQERLSTSQIERKAKSVEEFISIGSAEDERLIKRMNEKGVDLSKSEVIKEESKDEVKEEDKDEE